MWHSLFVGLPLLGAFLVGVVSVPIGYKGLNDGQFPPKGMKVYKPTKILRGSKAIFKSIFHVIMPLIFILLAVWGYFQLDTLPHDVAKDFDYSVCITNKLTTGASFSFF